MTQLANRESRYGFEAHKGYATARHRDALAVLGPCPFHRKTFRPVSDVLRVVRDMEDRLAAALQTQPEALDRHWRFFRDHYQAFSLASCRTFLAHFQEAGLPVLPSPRDPRIF